LHAWSFAHAIEMSRAVPEWRKIDVKLFGATHTPEEVGIWRSEVIKKEFPTG
jgi:hypothetical protein